MMIYTAILLYYGIRSFQLGMTNTFVSLDPKQGQCHPLPKKVDVEVRMSVGKHRTEGAW